MVMDGARNRGSQEEDGSIIYEKEKHLGEVMWKKLATNMDLRMVGIR